MKLYVRLKPYKPAVGNILRRYSYKGHIYLEGQWTIVDEELAQELATIYQRHRDPSSPLAFNIGDKHQATAIEKREKELRDEALRRAERPVESLVDSAVYAKNSEASKEAIEKDKPQKVIHVELDDIDELTAPEVEKVPDEKLGLSPFMKKDELIAYANDLGLDTEGMTKKAIYEVLKKTLS